MNDEPTRVEGRLPADAEGKRLDRALADVVPNLSRARIQALLSEGAIAIDGATVSSASTAVRADMQYEILLPAPTDSEAKPQDIPLNIVFEDEHLIIVDKPAGMVVHPAAGHPDGTLVNALLHHCRGQLSGIGGVSRPGIVHRIDKDTSGLMVAAKSDEAHRGLTSLFAKHDIERRYLAIVHGLPQPTEGRIEGNIGRSPNDRKKMAVVGPPNGKTAVTHYALIQPLKKAALVECRLETGRTHQVRVHMTHIGHPLIGDPVYRKRKNQLSLQKEICFCRQALHAAILGFNHPVTGEKLRFESKLPDDMQDLFSLLNV